VISNWVAKEGNYPC